MQWFYNMKLVNKILFGFLVTCGITIVVGYLGIRGMAKTNDMLEAVGQQHMKGLACAKSIQFDLMALGRELRQAIIFSDAATMASTAGRCQKYRSDLRRAFPNTKMASEPRNKDNNWPRPRRARPLT